MVERIELNFVYIPNTPTIENLFEKLKTNEIQQTEIMARLDKIQSNQEVEMTGIAEVISMFEKQCNPFTRTVDRDLRRPGLPGFARFESSCPGIPKELLGIPVLIFLLHLP